MQVLLADRALLGADLTPVDRAAVVVGDDGAIAWSGREADLPVDLPAGTARAAARRHLGDVTLMPGLIDAHVHLGFDGGPAPVARMMAEDDGAQVELMLRSARELLSVGVTTARDLGGRQFLGTTVREAIATGAARGPRLVVSGPPITITGGHCWFMGGEADTVDEVRTMVHHQHHHGVDLIKVMASGGNMTQGSAPWQAQFEAEPLQTIVAEAHRMGMKVAAHVHSAEAIARSLDAGVDTLEHCSFQVRGGTFETVPDIAARIAATGVFVSPTVSFRVPELLALMGAADLPVSDLYRRGARIIASTDAGIDDVAHYGYVGGLQALSSFGPAPPEILHAATTTAAEALGLGDRAGQLTPGYAADIIAVGGDPRTDLAVLEDLRLVMTNGQEFTPDPLPAIEPLPADYLPMNLRSS